MIGKIYSSVTPYFDRKTNRNSFKSRPALVISGPRNNDYTILPISTISIRSNLDPHYDIKIDPTIYPLLNLKKECFVRTHKQTVVHKASLVSCIGDMKSDYEDLYVDVLSCLEEYNNQVINDAL